MQQAGTRPPERRSMVTGSRELIRSMNRSLVLETIINRGPISRAETAKELGLTKATVSAIVQDLITEQYVEEVGSGDASMGRKPILLNFCRKNGYVLSADLQPSGISLLSCDLGAREGRIYARREIVTRKNIVPLLMEMIQEAMAEIPSTPFSVVGITLAIHGTVEDTEILFAPNYPLAGLPLVRTLSGSLHIPVWLENEANLSALAEEYFVRNLPNLIHINVHTGVGAGILIDHRPYRGKNGNAGELGHTTVVPDGRPCPCGNRGCLEQYISDPAILSTYEKLSGRHGLTMEDLAEGWLAGEQAAIQTVDGFVRYLALGVHNLGNLFSPDCIVVNSQLTGRLPELISIVRSCLPPQRQPSFELKASSLKDASTLLGGAYLGISRFLGIEKIFFRDWSFPTSSVDRK